MATEAFCNDEFDVKEWINKAFSDSQTSNLPLDAQASNVLLKLQMALNEASTGLEEAGRQAMANIPRVLRDIDTVRHDATTLREQLDTVREDIGKVERETGSSMASLSAVDKVKERISLAATAIKHAHDWEALEGDLDGQWLESDTAQVADKLGCLRQALKALGGLPDYAARTKQLKIYETRLEALMAPTLIDAFTNHDADTVIRLRHYFKSIGREDFVYEYYYSCHKAPSIAHWSTLLEGSAEAVPATFYDHLLALLEQEAPWLQKVFANASTVLCILLVRILTGLAPSPVERLANHIQSGSSGAALETLELVQRSLERTVVFIKAVDSVLLKLGEIKEPASKQLYEAVYGPFTAQQSIYGNLETAALLDNLNASVQLADLDYALTIHQMEDSVAVVFSFVQAAGGRCVSITGGLGLVGYLKAVDTVVEKYVGMVSAVLTNLHRTCQPTDQSARSQDELDFNTQDWSHFQGSLRLLEACGHMMQQLDRVDTRVRTDMANHAAQILAGTTTNLSQSYNYLVTTPSQEEELVMAIATMRSGGEILTTAHTVIRRLNDEVHKLAFNSVFCNIDRLLAGVPLLSAWTSNGLMGTGKVSSLKPFSITQQAYITQ
eukprot:Ihof_evm2s351 gene=Ihof_evmTU2s351